MFVPFLTTLLYFLYFVNPSLFCEKGDGRNSCDRPFAFFVPDKENINPGIILGSMAVFDFF